MAYNDTDYQLQALFHVLIAYVEARGHVSSCQYADDLEVCTCGYIDLHEELEHRAR